MYFVFRWTYGQWVEGDIHDGIPGSDESVKETERQGSEESIAIPEKKKTMSVILNYFNYSFHRHYLEEISPTDLL